MSDKKLFNKDEFNEAWETTFKRLTDIFGSDITNEESWIKAISYIKTEYEKSPENSAILSNITKPFETAYQNATSSDIDKKTAQLRMKISIRDSKEQAKMERLAELGQEMLSMEIFKKYCLERNEYVSKMPGLGLDKIGERELKNLQNIA